MKAKTFTESQIVKILKYLDSGKLAADVARENGVSKATLYNWHGLPLR
ncbi:transposase [Dyadobacter sp. LHD-138]|nr:transposase [Dyadobacter sp. LHD-138]MDQ6482645.1 transposase [Dyadobacter sp. LHD-138]